MWTQKFLIVIKLLLIHGLDNCL